MPKVIAMDSTTERDYTTKCCQTTDKRINISVILLKCKNRRLPNVNRRQEYHTALSRPEQY